MSNTVEGRGAAAGASEEKTKYTIVFVTQLGEYPNTGWDLNRHQEGDPGVRFMWHKMKLLQEGAKVDDIIDSDDDDDDASDYYDEPCFEGPWEKNSAAGFGLASLGTRIYVVGGRFWEAHSYDLVFDKTYGESESATYPRGYSRHVYSRTTEEKDWRKEPPMLIPRSRSAVLVHNKNLYSFGGESPYFINSPFAEVLDTDSTPPLWRALPPPPSAFLQTLITSAFVYKGKALLLFIDYKVLAFDFDSSQWEDYTDNFPNLFSCASVYSPGGGIVLLRNETLFVMNGRTLLAYDMESHIWNTLTVMPSHPTFLSPIGDNNTFCFTYSAHSATLLYAVDTTFTSSLTPTRLTRFLFPQGQPYACLVLREQEDITKGTAQGFQLAGF